MPQQVVLNFDNLDDPLLGDGSPSFVGGMVSNDQANLIGETESSELINCDRSRIGKITTRKGTVLLGDGPPGPGPIIQGMAFYWAGVNRYLVAAIGGKIYALAGGGWNQIALGGVFNDDAIEVVKTGAINNAAGYNVGDTTLVVDGFIGQVAGGDRLVLWNRDRTFEYVITGFALTGINTTSITVAVPGLAVKVYDNDLVVVKRFGARVNNVGGYAGGATSMTIDGITGTLGNGDKFIVKGEEVIHTITTHAETGANTTSVGFAPAVLGPYVSSDPTVPIIFALGANKLFWTDGILAIHSWDGTHTGNLAYGNIYDQGNSPPPTAVRSLVWFQNRLIAAGPASDPEGIWFSDFFPNENRWDSNFQQLDIGGGESDPIVAVVPWMDSNLVVFKEHSIYVINMDPSQNPDPSDPTLLVSSYQIKLVTHYVGCASARTIVQVGGEGGDIYFLGTDKQVRSLSRVIAAESQQQLGQSVSFPVQNVLDRITTESIGNTVAYYWNNRYLLGTPLDGNVYANEVQVFDTVLQNWSGRWRGVYDTASARWFGWTPTALCTMLITEGEQALAIGQDDGTVIQWLENTGADETDPNTYTDNGAPIVTSILTRAYTWGQFYNWKTGVNVELEFFDSLAMIAVSAAIDQATAAGSIGTFDTITFKPLILPFRLSPEPGGTSTLPTATFKRVQKDLQRFGQFRDLQIYLYSPEQKFSCRSIKCTAFLDSVQLQSLGDTPFLDSPMPSKLVAFP